MRHTIMDTSELLDEVLEEAVITVDQKQLILFNDDVNTFDHVMDCLVSICQHDMVQAEQCALITHYKGKCSVKRGDFEKLEPMGLALSEKGLTVEIQ